MIYLFFILISSIHAENLDPNLLQQKLEVDQVISSIGPDLICTASPAENSKFICNDFKTSEGCLMQKCSGKISWYPRDIDVFIPKKIDRLSMHFHGHVLAGYEKYSNGITEKNDPFNLAQKICTSNELTVFPKSIKNCATYDVQFTSASKFDQFIDSIATDLGLSSINKLPITLSAHSGGGRALSRILNGTRQNSDGLASQRIDHAVYYDGLYNSWQPAMIKDWFESNPKVKLDLIALTNQPKKVHTPDLISQYTFSDLSNTKVVSTQTEILDKKTFETKISMDDLKQLRLFNRNYTGSHTQNHFDVVSETWAITHP